MLTLFIDPGSAGRGNACAAFDVTPSVVALQHVWFERYDVSARPRVRVSTVVVERPEYQGRRTLNARPQDLMALAWSGAFLAGRYVGAFSAELIELPPSQWKGAESKPLMHRRLWQILSPREQHVLGGADTWARIDAACERGALKRWSIDGASCYGKSKGADVHNLLDAVAMGATYTGRLKKA